MIFGKELQVIQTVINITCSAVQISYTICGGTLIRLSEFVLGTDHLTWGGLWFFVSFRIFFSDNTRVRIFIFFVAQSAKFFFQNTTLGYMTKTLNQIIFFCLHQNQNIFFSNTGNQNIFLEKNHIHVYIAFEVKLPLVV